MDLRRAIDLVEFLDKFRNPDGIKMDAIQYHDVLNPKIWNSDGTLRPEVEKAFWKIVKAFESVMRLGQLPITDITIQGSNANYHYTQYSDVDLHLVIDPARLNLDEKTAFELFYAKGERFNSQGIHIRGVQVEVFVETPKTNPAAGGVYSLKKHRWLSQPVPVETIVDQTALKQKVREYINEIKVALQTGDPYRIKNTIGGIIGKRRRALNAAIGTDNVMSGEASLENQAWKVLKASGWVDRCWKAIDQARTNKLSVVDESLLLEEVLTEFMFDPQPPVRQFKGVLHPEIWPGNGEKLNPVVRDGLLKIADAFIKFCKIKLDVKDIQMKGSLTNYNWDEHSDIDVNILAPITDEHMDDYLIAKKLLWKKDYKGVQVFGYDVEPSVRDPNAVHSSDGIYSLMQDRWVRKPFGDRAQIDWDAVRALARQWFQECLVAKKSGKASEASRVRNKIIGIRNKVLDGSKGAEYKTENLAYKAVNRTGIIKELEEMMAKGKSANLSTPAPK